ncbi:MAG: hypothetical protein HQK73_09770 [Desulfamplus sp.]|nr:hypothetical protein [Desulfamplus sp.]MBF0413998.1 hypothetical protein [Desulfamplus sp.]
MRENRFNITDNNYHVNVDEDFFFPFNILLFSAGGFFFGIYSSQVKTVDASNYDKGTTNRLLKTELIISPSDGHKYRVQIGVIEDIISVTKNDIAAFPAIIEPWAIKWGMWAVMPRNNRIYILLDFKYLIASLSEKNFPLCNDNSYMVDKESALSCNDNSCMSYKESVPPNKKLQYTLFNGELIITQSDVNDS